MAVAKWKQRIFESSNPVHCRLGHMIELFLASDVVSGQANVTHSVLFQMPARAADLWQ